MADNLEKKISQIADMLIEDYKGEKTIDRINLSKYPNRETVIDILENIRTMILPGYYKHNYYRNCTVRANITILLEDVICNLSEQISIVLKYVPTYSRADAETIKAASERITFEFLKTIPKIRALTETDIEAAYDGDPAAYNEDEIICTYPGLYAILTARIAHELFVLGVPLIPRIMTEHAHSATGIDIHPGTTIGKYFFIDHGTGIVIGETTEIGDNVKIYQGVTLGALSTRGGQNLRHKKRHPTIKDNVTIYSGASILGGETVIGKDVVIGGNAFITSSVPDGAKISVKSQELAYNYDSGKELERKEFDAEENWFYMI